MDRSGHCPECGQVLPEQSPKGMCPACLVALATAPLEEDDSPEAGPARRVDDYELQEEIAHGGMGVVFRARQVSLNRPVAVKMIRTGQFAGSAELQRFQTEAEAAANLDHPNIVPIYEIGRHAGQPYFSMKLVEGESLAKQIGDGLWRPAGETARERQRAIAGLLVKVACAVRHAHERGVLHRDLKPSNILIDDHGEPQLTDFGLAKITCQDTGLTLTDVVMGTPNYMSPEQAAGKSRSVTTATDIYSLGAILYDLLTGRPPFEGDTPMETVQHVLDHDPSRVRSLNPEIDLDLETICHKCLEKEPARRYPAVEYFSADLEHWLRGEPIAARPVSPLERAWKWTRRNKTPVRLGLILMLSLIFGVAGFVWQRDRARQGELRKDLQQVERLFAEEQPRLALATLAHLLRQNRANRVVAERALSGLAQQGFLVPAGPSLPGDFRFACWSADGRHFLLAGASADGARFQVWHQDGRLIGAASNALPQVTAAAISPEGRLVALSAKDRVQVWETTGAAPEAPAGRARLLLDQAASAGLVRQIQFPTDRQLLVMTGGRVQLWAVPEGDVLREFGGESSDLLHMTVHAGAGRLAAADRTASSLRVWRLDSGQETSIKPTGHTGIIRDLQFGPDGRRLVSASADHTARIWELERGESLGVLRHDDAVQGAAFSPDGSRLVTASRDGTARLWVVGTGRLLGPVMAHSNAVFQARFSPDGHRLVTAADDRSVRLWDGHTAQSIAEPVYFTNWIREVGFAPESQALSVLLEREGLHRLAWLSPQRLLPIDQGPPPPPEAKLPAREMGSLAKRQAGQIIFVDVSPDQRLVATGSSDRTACVYERASGRPLIEPLKHDAVVNCVRFSPDSLRLVTSTANRTIRLWDVLTGTPLTAPIASELPVARVWFAPEGTYVLADTGQETGGAQAWPFQPVDAIAPAWLPDLLEAVVGLHLDEHRAEIPVSSEAFLRLQAFLNLTRPAGPLSGWVRQFLDRPNAASDAAAPVIR